MKFVAATILALATSASAFAPAPSASVSSFFKFLKLLIDPKISNWNGICEDGRLYYMPLIPSSSPLG